MVLHQRKRSINGLAASVARSIYKRVESAGQVVKTESSPGGEEIVYGTVPPGKKWLICFTVHIEQVDE